MQSLSIGLDHPVSVVILMSSSLFVVDLWLASCTACSMQYYLSFLFLWVGLLLMFSFGFLWFCIFMLLCCACLTSPFRVSCITWMFTVMSFLFACYLVAFEAVGFCGSYLPNELLQALWEQNFIVGIMLLLWNNAYYGNTQHSSCFPNVL